MDNVKEILISPQLSALAIGVAFSAFVSAVLFCLSFVEKHQLLPVFSIITVFYLLSHLVVKYNK